MPLQIARAGVRQPGAEETARLAAEFEDRHAVRLPGLLEPRLLEILQARMDRHDAWTAHTHHLAGGDSTELAFADTATLGLLSALFNDPWVFRAVRAITDCDPIAAFQGRIYRMDPGAHRDVWHTDANGNYMIALSLNLTRGPFEGGELHLRERGRGRVHAEVANTGPGDAILFRIDGALEHVVRPVTGRTPKIAWAGWFQREVWIPALGRLAGL
jgi:hypothetical protein